MKKSILLLISIVILSSCGGNDDSHSGIIGKWQKTRETKEYVNGNLEEVSLSDCDLKETIELKSNSKVVLTKYSGDNCEEPRLSTGSYSYNESTNELTLPGNNKQIVEVDGNEMNFKFTISGQENYTKTVYFISI